MAYAQDINDSNSFINEPTFLSQVDSFFNNLIKLSEPESQHIFKKYRPVIARELDMENLYVPTYQELTKLLNLAVYESIDVLTLFTLPIMLQKENKALVLDKKILLQLNSHYNLHGLFLISAQSLENESIIQMDFLISGQGKLIIGYDKSMTITHPDYSFATGKYYYRELFIMDAKKDDKGNPGLFNIKGISNPSEDFKGMKGPLNTTIKSLSLSPGQGNKKNSIVRYKFLGTSTKRVPCIPIETIFHEN